MWLTLVSAFSGAGGGSIYRALTVLIHGIFLLPGLRIVKEMLDKVPKYPAMTQTFYANFYLEILQQVLAVMTDSAQLAGQLSSSLNFILF